MKLKALTIAVAALAVAHTASAQTIVNITGATAFRTATLNTIKARFNASGAAWKLAHDQNAGNNQAFNGATLSIFEGTFPGVTGTTIIRTSFNGSVEGIKALVDSPASDPNYLQTNVLTSITAAIGGNSENGAGNGKGGVSTPVEAVQSDIAFSDVAKAATPFKNSSLQPTTASEAGVVTFTMVGSESFPTTVTNLNTQNFRALLSAGFQPLSFLSGDPADSSKTVYVTGRNDGSGTRTTYMAETLAGITTTVNQFLVGGTSGDTITKIYKVPAGGVSAGLTGLVTGLGASNASTVWGQDIDGNGGYSSGSTLRGDLARTSTSVTVYDADGSELDSGANIALVSWLSTSDANTARTGGAKILGYNGVRLDDYATTGTLSAIDLRKITNGAYTAWSYQQMYRRNDLISGDKVAVYNGIKTNLVLGSSGVASTAMNAFRGTDGGVVAP